MKKFLIFKKLEDGSYGEKMMSYEAEDMDDTSRLRSHLASEPNASHFELLEGQDEELVVPTLVEGEWILQ